MEPKTQLYAHRGNVFRLRFLPEKAWQITDIRAGRAVLSLPEEAYGLPVTQWVLPEGRSFPAVTGLEFSSSLKEVRLWNGAFPSLKEISVPEGSPFFALGTMLLSDGNRDGTRKNYLKTLFGSVDEYYQRRYKDPVFLRLLYVFGGGEKASLTLPACVRSIAASAFAGTSCREILCESPDLVLEEGALTGCAWEEENEYLASRDTLIALTKPVKDLSLREGITRLGPASFSRFCPGSLSLDALSGSPGRFPRESAGVLQSLTLRDPEAELNMDWLLALPGLSHLTLPPGHVLYQSREGMVYDREGKTLLYCPRAYEKEKLLLPPGTVSIGREAFQGCQNPRWAQTPPSLEVIGERAFQGSGLTRLFLSPGLRMIREEALKDTSLSSLTLPPTVTGLGEGSLLGIRSLTLTEGTGKGLLEALYGGHSAMALPHAVWLTVLSREGEPSYLYLPRYLTLPGRRALREAWEGSRIDYGAYALAARYATQEEEKLLMSLLLALQAGEETAGKHRDLAREKDLGVLLLEKGPEGLFLKYVKSAFMSPAEAEALLSLCNDRGRTDLIGYLLACRGSSPTDSSFSL